MRRGFGPGYRMNRILDMMASNCDCGLGKTLDKQELTIVGDSNPGQIEILSAVETSATLTSQGLDSRDSSLRLPLAVCGESLAKRCSAFHPDPHAFPA